MSQSPPRYAWLIVLLLFLFMLINFADKTVIGLAAAPIMKELNLTPSQFGLLASSYSFLFSISGIVTGFIVNRIETRWALAAMAAIWAITQFPMMGSVGFGAVIACRVLLGGAEGPSYPVALHSVFKWFPDELRTLPTAVVTQGASIGVVVALPMLNCIIVRLNWHWAFGALGFIGLAWVLAWLVFGREGAVRESPRPGCTSTTRLRHTPYRWLLLNTTTLAFCAAGFGANWGLSLLIAWLPSYLTIGLGYSQQGAGLLTAVPWACNVVIMFGAGWGSQRLLLRGTSSRIARGVLGGSAVALGGAALLLMPHVDSAALKLALLVLGICAPLVIFVVGFAAITEFTPVSQRGAMLAITNGIASSASVIGPYVMGHVIETGVTSLEGFHLGFFICGVISLVGGIIGMAFIHPEAEVARLTTADAAMFLAPAK